MDIGLKDLSLPMIPRNDTTPDARWKGLLRIWMLTSSRLSGSDGMSGPSWARKNSTSVTVLPVHP